MRTQVGKWGSSLAVRIPGTWAKVLGWEEGTILDVSLVGGALVLRPRIGPYTLDELVAGITLENRHGETDWGEAAGNEAW
jgi:antitoxin MazE